MHKTFKYGVAAVATILASTLMAGSALATADVNVEGNGANSTNTVNVSQFNGSSVSQSNTSIVSTHVSSSASTGGNTANKNTGGDVAVVSGDATSVVDVAVTGGTNEATANPCGCPSDSSPSTVNVSGNGAGSLNVVNLWKKVKSSISQVNTQVVGTSIWSKAKTGGNKANQNTGGSTGVQSGNATTGTVVSVGGSSNTLNP